jgi:hypothetical protein
MGQVEMKCRLYFCMDQGYSGERCGPWASFCTLYRSYEIDYCLLSPPFYCFLYRSYEIDHCTLFSPLHSMIELWEAYHCLLSSVTFSFYQKYRYLKLFSITTMRDFYIKRSELEQKNCDCYEYILFPPDTELRLKIYWFHGSNIGSAVAHFKRLSYRNTQICLFSLDHYWLDIYQTFFFFYTCTCT